MARAQGGGGHGGADPAGTDDEHEHGADSSFSGVGSAASASEMPPLSAAASGSCVGSPAAAGRSASAGRRPRALLALARRRGQDDAAGRLGDHVARGLADERVVEAALAAQQRPAAHAGRLLGGQHDRLDPAALGLAHDPLAGAARAHGRGGDLDALVLLPHRLGALERLAGALEVLVGDARVERQRHRHLEHPHRLDHRAALALVRVLLRRQPAGGLHDVVVERRARGPARGSSRTRPSRARGASARARGSSRA